MGAELRQAATPWSPNSQAARWLGVKRMTFDTIAIRGGASSSVVRDTRAATRSRCVQHRGPQYRRDRRRRRIAAFVTFDPDDFDAAIAELDARYIAGEARAHARTWSVIAGAYAAFNRRELPPTTPDWVNIDHRRGAQSPRWTCRVLPAAWDDTPDPKNFVEAVHRLNNIGAVVTHMANEISQEGFDAEWRDVSVSRSKAIW